MNTIPPDHDPLDRATDALRRVPAPDGPTVEILARTLVALRAATVAPGVIPLRKRKLMLTILKVAAAALVGAVGLFYAAGPSAAESTFTEVARKLHEARTISYRSTSNVPGLPEPMTMRNFFKEPGLMRAEMTAQGGAGAVTILDAVRGKTLVVMPMLKSALLMEQTKPKDKEDPATQAVEWLRGLVGKKGEPAGRERIGDVEAEGFRVIEKHRTLIVWADPKSQLPIRVDATASFDGKEIRATLSDFQLDPKLDDSLFALDPPAGYSVQRIKGTAMFDAPETNVARVLRAYAEKKAGAFPKALDLALANEFDAIFPKDKNKNMFQGDPEVLDLAMSLGQALSYKPTLKGCGYSGEGVKIGDADKIVFWYQPEGSEKYRAVYGDLHIGDVEAGQLPEKAKP
jgi:outer membrane lipoprotein-sorting protein